MVQVSCFSAELGVGTGALQAAARRPQWRGARPKLENENFARARPVEGGKPGLSGQCRAFGQPQGLPLRRRVGRRQPWPPAKEDLEPVAG